MAYFRYRTVLKAGSQAKGENVSDAPRTGEFRGAGDSRAPGTLSHSFGAWEVLRPSDRPRSGDGELPRAFRFRTGIKPLTETIPDWLLVG